LEGTASAQASTEGALPLGPQVLGGTRLRGDLTFGDKIVSGTFFCWVLHRCGSEQIRATVVADTRYVGVFHAGPSRLEERSCFVHAGTLVTFTFGVGSSLVGSVFGTKEEYPISLVGSVFGVRKEYGPFYYDMRTIIHGTCI